MYLFKKSLLIGLSVFSLASLAQIPDGLTADWREISTSQDEKKMFYVHSRSIERKGNIVKAWYAVVDLSNYTSAKVLQEINCNTKQMRGLTIINYTNSNFSGNGSSFHEPGKWSHIVPDSVGDINRSIMCTSPSKNK